MKPLLPFAVLCVCASASSAQGIPKLVPFDHTRDLYLSDSGDDKVWRLQDLDLDGDYDDAGEFTVFYDDTVGPQILTNNNGIAVGLGGIVYVSDSSTDVITALRDKNGDGDAHDAGESWNYFNGTSGGNPGGIVMVSSSNMSMDQGGALYVAVSNTTSGKDMVLRIRDNNFDGDANDLGEAFIYWDILPGAPTGDSLPQDVVVGLDGHLYVLDIPSSGANPKGIYRTDDLNGNGTIESGEWSVFFAPSGLANAPFYWGLAQALDGSFYFADTTNERVWKVRDANGDGSIDPQTEALVYWQAAPDTTSIWKCVPESDGGLLCAENEGDDRLLRLVDLDHSGVIDQPAEVQTAYDETVAPLAVGNPRSLALARRPELTASTAQIGQPAFWNIIATQGDLVSTWYSTGTSAPFAIAPFGDLALSFFGPDVFGPFYVGVCGTLGFHGFSVTVPNDPLLVGTSFHTQALVGTAFRLQTSTLASQIVQ